MMRRQPARTTSDRFFKFYFHFTFTLTTLRCCAICGSILNTSKKPHTQQPHGAEDRSIKPPPPHAAEKSLHQRLKTRVAIGLAILQWQKMFLNCRHSPTRYVQRRRRGCTAPVASTTQSEDDESSVNVLWWPRGCCRELPGGAGRIASTQDDGAAHG